MHKEGKNAFHRWYSRGNKRLSKKYEKCIGRESVGMVLLLS